MSPRPQRRLGISLLVLASLSGVGEGQAQTTRSGDALVRTRTNPVTGEKNRTVFLTSRDGVMGLYIFCVDTRTPNVSLFLTDGTFRDWGYLTGARIPVTWQADSRRSVPENWEVIGRDDDLRRYGKLGLVTAELFVTQQLFTAKLFDQTYVFPARGLNPAMRQLPCVVPFLKSTGYLK